MSEARVCVVGSLNMDLVVRAPEFARPGRTVVGCELARYPGGKGANQAVAASRLGAQVDLVGALGTGDWGDELRSTLLAEGVGAEHVLRLPDHRTGVGVVTVVEGGENAILVASGANFALAPEHVDAARRTIEEADALLLQNEVPAAVNRRAIEVARAAGTRVFLNAAPAEGLDPELIAAADVVVANRDEAAALCRAGEDEEVAPAGAARRIAARGPDVVCVTLGAAGAVAFDGEEVLREAAPPVEAVDAVGAGDAFAAALAVELSAGSRLATALRVACAAGALATTAPGAIPSLPQRPAVAALRGSR